jgi:hypothetical protein
MTFRYTFSQPFADELCDFAKLHRFEDRDSFKESWSTWVADNKEMIEEETYRLYENHYRGDVLQKMFKSAKYYFCHKRMTPVMPVKRKTYDSADKSLLQLMDAHIMDTHTCPPKQGFLQFCELYSKDANDVSLKKKYKNRHFRQSSHKKKSV